MEPQGEVLRTKLRRNRRPGFRCAHHASRVLFYGGKSALGDPLARLLTCISKSLIHASGARWMRS